MSSSRTRIIVTVILGFSFTFHSPLALVASQPKPTIKIGVVLSLSGGAEEWSANAQNGIKLALAEINAAGGVNGAQVEVIYRDCETNAEKAKEVLQELITEHKVQAVIGDVTSTCALALAEVANQNQVVLITPGASHPDLSKKGDFVFRYWYSDELEGKDDARYAKEKRNWHRVVTLYIDIPYGQGINKVFVREFKDKGGDVTKQIPFKLRQTDFTSQITQALQEPRPDGLFLVGYKDETIAVLKQLKKRFTETNNPVPILSTQAFHNLSIVKKSEGAAEGVVFSVPRPPDDSNMIAQRFREAYKQEYNRDLDEDPADFSDTAYDALNILVSALRSGASTGPEIRRYIETLEDYSGAVGRVTFNSNGDIPRDFAFKQVRNGKFEFASSGQLAAPSPTPAGSESGLIGWLSNTTAQLVATLFALLLAALGSWLIYRFWFSIWQWWQWRRAVIWFWNRKGTNKSGRKIVTLNDYVDLLEKLRGLIVKRCNNLSHNEKSKITIYSYTMQLLRDWPLSEVDLEQVRQSPTPLEQYFIHFEAFKNGSETQKYEVVLKRVIVIDSCEGPNGKARRDKLEEDVNNDSYYEKYIQILHTDETDAYYYEHQRPWPGWLADSVFYAITEPGRGRRWLWGVTTSYNVGEDLIILRLHRLGKRGKGLAKNLALPFQVSSLDELAEMMDVHMARKRLSSLRGRADTSRRGSDVSGFTDPAANSPTEQSSTTPPTKE